MFHPSYFYRIIHKSMNPILVNYECDKNKLFIKKGKTFSKTFTTNTEVFDNVNHNNINNVSHYTHTPYSVMYNYPNNIVSLLSILTRYVPLKYHTFGVKNKFNSCTTFVILPSDDNQEDKNFKDFIFAMCDDIKKKVEELVGNNVNFSFPYDNAEKCTFTIYLKSINKKINPNEKIKTYYNICPIHFHQPKSRGGNVIVINKDEINETKKNIDKEMPMFKKKLYMKKISDPKYADLKDIHYVGKFVFGFEVEVSTYSTEFSGHNNITCKIHLVANEMEIKHNVSYVKSVLYDDIININVKQNDLTTITI